MYHAGAIDRPGTNQRFHSVDERLVRRRPRSLAAAQAAALPLTAITAWEALLDHLRLTADSTGTLLVVGASGGVGTIMVQLVEALLPHVTLIATASSPERAEHLKELGAEHVVDHHGNLAAQVLDLCPDGVQWLFTAYSEGQVDTYATIVAPFGHVVAIDDGPRDIEALKSKAIAWHWEFMFAGSLHHTDDMHHQHDLLNRVAELVDTGQLTSVIARELAPISVDPLREAHALVEDGHLFGKVVLRDWQ